MQLPYSSPSAEYWGSQNSLIEHVENDYANIHSSSDYHSPGAGYQTIMSSPEYQYAQLPDLPPSEYLNPELLFPHEPEVVNVMEDTKNIDICHQGNDAPDAALRMLTIRESTRGAYLQSPHLPTHGRSNQTARRASEAVPVGQEPMTRMLHPLSAAAIAMGIELNETERLLLEFREVQQLPWITCGQEFKSRGRNIQVPALQMRYKRLKDRLILWDAEDLKKLNSAKLIVDARITKVRYKWIADELNKMHSKRNYTPAACEAKLRTIQGPRASRQKCTSPRRSASFSPESS